MKYIKGQDGGIYSVSRLMPPCRRSNKGEPFWGLSVITAEDLEHRYAAYSTEEMAVRVYRYVLRFMGSDKPMLSFGLGRDAIPYVEYVSDLRPFDEKPMVEEEADDDTARDAV